MSLINKMLQDLDARGSDGAAPGYAHPQVRPAMSAELAARLRAHLGDSRVLAGGALLLLALAGGWYAWQKGLFKARAPAAARSAPSLPIAPAPGVELRNEGAPIAVPDAEAQAVLEQAAQPPAMDGVPGEPLSQALDMKLSTALSSLQAPERGTGPARPRALPARKAVPALAAAAAPSGNVIAGRDGSAAQRAEAEYRDATVLLQQGRVIEAIAGLERAVAVDPGHQAARQTLIGLLVESRRNAEAMRHLQASLSQDVNQPELAMLLGRLLLDNGYVRSAIDVMNKTLPAAGANGDYHALLGALLQREKRHRDAVERYQAALRAQPGNGVWWMGMGISLQADGRQKEALDAFVRARQSGTLSMELSAFVEQKIAQLSR